MDLFRYASVLWVCALASGFAHVVVCVFAMAWAHKSDLRPMLWSLVVVTLLLGGLVTAMDALRTAEVLCLSSVDAKQVMLPRGMWFPLYDRVGVMLVVMGQLLATAGVEVGWSRFSRGRR